MNQYAAIKIQLITEKAR